jgi:hypothetical protein
MVNNLHWILMILLRTELMTMLSIIHARLSRWRPDEADKFMVSPTRSEFFAPPLPAPRHCGLATPFDAPQAN